MHTAEQGLLFIRISGSGVYEWKAHDTLKKLLHQSVPCLEIGIAWIWSTKKRVTSHHPKGGHSTFVIHSFDLSPVLRKPFALNFLLITSKYYRQLRDDARRRQPFPPNDAADDHGVTIWHSRLTLFTTDAISTLILRSNIYLAMLVLIVSLYRLGRADDLRRPSA